MQDYAVMCCFCVTLISLFKFKIFFFFFLLNSTLTSCLTFLGYEVTPQSQLTYKVSFFLICATFRKPLMSKSANFLISISVELSGPALSIRMSDGMHFLMVLLNKSGQSKR